MTMNLVQHRAQPNVWDRTGTSYDWDAERWLVAIMAGALLVSGFRRRGPAGLAFAAAVPKGSEDQVHICALSDGRVIWRGVFRWSVCT